MRVLLKYGFHSLQCCVFTFTQLHGYLAKAVAFCRRSSFYRQGFEHLQILCAFNTQAPVLKGGQLYCTGVLMGPKLTEGKTSWHQGVSAFWQAVVAP